MSFLAALREVPDDLARRASVWSHHVRLSGDRGRRLDQHAAPLEYLDHGMCRTADCTRCRGLWAAVPADLQGAVMRRFAG